MNEIKGSILRWHFPFMYSILRKLVTENHFSAQQLHNIWGSPIDLSRTKISSKEQWED